MYLELSLQGSGFEIRAAWVVLGDLERNVCERGGRALEHAWVFAFQIVGSNDFLHKQPLDCHVQSHLLTCSLALQSDLYTPTPHGSNDQEPEEALSRSPVKSHWQGHKPASDRGAGACTSSGRQSLQSNSLGSSCDPDDDIKAIMARALHGMKAQEAVNLKRTMRTMQQKVKEHMEAKLSSLQNVLSQYQA